MIRPLLQKVWLGKKWLPTDTFNVYIDSPFCVQQCRFCFLNPTHVQSNGDSLHRDYYAALINEIHEWGLILRSHPIDSVYFGGGTSTLMSPSIMKELFESLPNFGEIKSKCFECDPTSLTKEKIDLLGEYQFSYLTFGVQTLDEAELIRQRRVNPTMTKLKALTEYALDKGIYVSYDIMAFLNPHFDTDITRLSIDISHILETLRPTAVDIYPTSPNLEGDPQQVLQNVRSLRNVLVQAAKRYADYSLADQAKLEFEEISFTDRYRNYFLVYTRDLGRYLGEIKTYSCSDPKAAPLTQNTLGFGGYGSREVYSYLDNNQICYHSRFDHRSGQFLYF